MVFLFFVSDEKMTYGSTAQFGKLIRREIFHQVKVRKVKEYSMYFDLSNRRIGGKDPSKREDAIARCCLMLLPELRRV